MTKRIQTRERIIDVANRLFYEEGIRAVSVDTISEKAGISKKTLYYHFKNKEELIAAHLSDLQELARHIVLLMDGVFSTVLIHRDAAYADCAARAARAMIAAAPRTAAPGRAGQAPR